MENAHKILETNRTRFKLCRSFIWAVRFDTWLIRSKEHRPFQIVASQSVYDYIELELNFFFFPDGAFYMLFIYL